MYPEELIAPMREELTKLGVKEARTPDEVETLLAEKGVTMVVVNSVCGCAAANARPAVAMALQNDKLPQQSITVFAGTDAEATAKAREYFIGIRPSSPSIGLLKDGECVWVLERHQIEGRDAEEIGNDLKEAFNKFC